MKSFFLSCCICFLVNAISFSQPETPAFPVGSEKLFNESMKLVSAKHAKWIKSTAKEVNEKKMSESEVKAKAASWAVLGDMNGQDIEGLSFLVLMQAANSAQEDLKAVMAKVKAINKQKALQRETLQKVQQKQGGTRQQLDSFRLISNQSKAYITKANPDTVRFRKTGIATSKVTRSELDALVDVMKNDLDSMSEMGEMESLRMQMAMDRMRKMMSTLSNILKKISDTAQAITQNLK